MSQLLTEKLQALPIPGISPHMHIFTAFRDRVETRNNDRVYIRKDGLEFAFVMPPVAVNYSSFLKMCGAAAEAEGAIC
jgi:hypothetical protein